MVQKNIWYYLFFFSNLLDHSFWIKYNISWNLSVIINEAIKEYISYREIYHPRSLVSENYFRIIFVSMSKNNNDWVVEHLSGPIALTFSIFDRQTIFLHALRVSWNYLSKTHGKTRWNDFLYVRQKNWIILLYWQLLGENKENINILN